MKARPILFSGPMVRALLAGNKTQTRRIMKPQPTEDFWGIFKRFPHQNGCPYGEAGDLLWVREGFSYDRMDDERDGSFSPWYWADGNPEHWDWSKPKPSIHMPRWASRLTLELTGVRVERLQDISEADAIAEGCFFTDYGRRCFHEGQGDVVTCPAPAEHHQQKPGWMWARTTSSDQCLGSARHAYGNLWQSINGPGSWDANPWVWVLAFNVHHVNVDTLLREQAA